MSNTQVYGDKRISCSWDRKLFLSTSVLLNNKNVIVFITKPSVENSKSCRVVFMLLFMFFVIQVLNNI